MAIKNLNGIFKEFYADSVITELGFPMPEKRKFKAGDKVKVINEVVKGGNKKLKKGTIFTIKKEYIENWYEMEEELEFGLNIVDLELVEEKVQELKEIIDLGWGFE